MPRSTVLSNGRLFVAHDHLGSARELCWPYVGYPNHLHGHKIRLGLWVDGTFWWCDGYGTRVTISEDEDSLAYVSLIEFDGKPFSLTVREWVHSNSDWWIREITFNNHSDTDLLFRLFQTHDLRLNETDISDTAFYHAFIDTIVHYKDTVACGFFPLHHRVGLKGYACGIKNFQGMLGTWKDAEDGELSMKAIEQGTVDSTMYVELTAKAGSTEDVSFGCVFGDSISAVEREQNAVRSIWSIGALKAPDSPTGESLGGGALTRTSIRVVNAHYAVGRRGAGLVAASDSDIMTTNRANYGNVWLRDHSLTCLTMLRAGQVDLIQESVAFGLSVLHEDNCPFGRPKVFAQKYLPNGRIGPSWHPWISENGPEHPWQEDESALFVSFVTAAVEAGKAELLPVQWSEFMSLCHAIADAIHPDGLPLPSWDLWEERRGIHFFTVATVIDALQDASRMMMTRSMEAEAKGLKLKAETMKRAAIKQFVRPDGVVARMIQREGSEYRYDCTCDSSVLAGLLRKCFRQERDLLHATVERCQDVLGRSQAIGGIARYEHDYYFRTSAPSTGNPWIISTLWLAQALIALGQTDKARDLVEWVEQRATPTRMLAEQYNPETGEPLSVQPLAWSHAEYLETIMHLAQSRR